MSKANSSPRKFCYVKVARRCYQERVVATGKPTGRYKARYPVNGRYTWKLLKETHKGEAIAAAQSTSGNVTATGFAALATAYLAAGCPTRKQKFKRPSAAFITAETRQAEKLVEYFRTRPVAEVNDLLQVDPYATWRQRQFPKDRGGRAVDKEIQTLSNIINYAVFATKQERINFIHSNRPRYHTVKSPSRNRMPESADVIHQLCEHFLTSGRTDGRARRSEVFAWLTLFQMFTGCRTSELLRLRLDAAPGGSGAIVAGQLHLGHRSKGGIDPWVNIGIEFEQMIACFKNWHRARFPKSQCYFCGPRGDVLDDTAHVHALGRACQKLKLPHITPHGLRAYYVTKRRRDGINDNVVAAEIGDTTVSLIAVTYGRNLGGDKLTFTPSKALPSWLLWQPEQNKITRIA